MRKVLLLIALTAATATGFHCTRKDAAADTTPSYPAVAATFGNRIDLANLSDYAGQGRPAYIVKDNTAGNAISNAKATLGRVLFYDTRLSISNSVSCGSCHRQAFAFGDTAVASAGVEGGSTGRHSMRLVNARFGNEVRFFWDERAATLEQQVTKPIQDHAEMGFSGLNGRPGIGTLLTRLSGVDYYQELFRFAYGDATVTEARMQECLAQFVRSIQSFDSKYDAGRAQVANNNAPFPNFTAQENQGKNLFTAAPVFGAGGQRTGGGLGCNGCHNAPEFDIDPNSRNNGITGTIGNTGTDLNSTRAPSLRDLLRPDGTLNGPLMHTGAFTSLQQVLNHYGNIPAVAGNNNLDPRLRPGGNPQRLNLTAAEVTAVVAFLRTLSGTNVYTDPKWSDPFR
ncbi:cytochrome-c peroxidase [Flaviaesturariibacter amylovorans]|uniref:Cytochrome c peroxidase n=1 Tax=Flaviaesturariibacter amylovorans TaxID=1084520 RepID=A0ABP8G704_9BACT